MKPFPAQPERPAKHANPALQGAFEPWPCEGYIHDLEVAGTLPQDLQGTYYRNGPNPQYVLNERYHLFDGDGMVHAFAFSGGRVRYRNRWVRTEKFELERAAGRSLFGGMLNWWRDPSVADGSPNLANTSLIRHGGRLLALYEAGLPTEIDPLTLETLGPFDFEGGLDRAMTAHPKRDPPTGELLFYSYIFGATRELVFYRADASGAILESRKIPTPFQSMIHDFAITESYVIFPLFPLTLNRERIAKGQSPIAWEPGLGTRFAVVPRRGDEPIRWFRTEACFAFHFMNAYEDGGTIVLDAIVADRIPENARPFQGGKDEFPTRLIRWTLDGESQQVGKEVLDDSRGEMPRMDERFCGRKYRHGYFVAQSDAAKPEGLWNTVVHIDLHTKTTRKLTLPGEDALSEAVFVPKGEGEGEGYLLVLAYRGATGKSDLLILDAAAIDAGPIAEIRIPHRVPVGFHGCWLDAAA
ncbi:MAG: carotenoid oxygenase family protein [Fibrobacteria bacterium]